jgi:hypothetical protein
MQTFLPYADFEACARCLDSRRLGNQRLEALIILRTLRRQTSGGWRHHPAVKMWRGYENALAAYLNAACAEWVRRGYRNSIRRRRVRLPLELPPWLGDERLHASHRSNLLRKDPAHYGRFGWREPPVLPYYWPEAGER